jgi:hypothetical protein
VEQRITGVGNAIGKEDRMASVPAPPHSVRPTISGRATSVRFDPIVAERVERAAHLTRQSPDSFVRWAADLAARSILLEDAVRRYREGERSLSELADETGLAVEAIMDAVAAAGGVRDNPAGLDAATEMFLASSRTAAKRSGASTLWRLADRVVAESFSRSRRRRSRNEPKR